MNYSFVTDSAQNVVSLLITSKNIFFFEVEFYMPENLLFAIFSFSFFWGRGKGTTLNLMSVAVKHPVMCYRSVMMKATRIADKVLWAKTKTK